MKTFLVCLLVHVTLGVSLHTFSFDAALKEEFNDFQEAHGKQYRNDEEENVRFAIYMANKRLIEQHNEEHGQGKHNYTLKMNHFGDMMHEEFVATMNGYRSYMQGEKTGASFIRPDKSVKVPDSIDWREKGAVTPVKNQGQCGSCWAFSTTGSLEGQHFRKTGKLVSLSEQNLVDCSVTFGNQGCNGGLMDQAFKYVKANGGIDTEASYPYDARDEPCHFKRLDVGATDVGYTDIEHGDEQALAEAVAIHGPISVAIDAGHRSFQFYSSGVYSDQDCSSDQLDHGVLVVGYGAETDDQGESQDYFLVKNSWGESWGEQGYIKMARNMDNMCGIASQASFPLV